MSDELQEALTALIRAITDILETANDLLQEELDDKDEPQPKSAVTTRPTTRRRK